MISSKSIAARIAWRTLTLSVGGLEKFGYVTLIRKRSLRASVSSLLLESRFCEAMGTSSTPWISPTSSAAVRAAASVIMRNVTVSTQACL